MGSKGEGREGKVVPPKVGGEELRMKGVERMGGTKLRDSAK